MKKSIVKLSFLFFILITFSSCYTYTHTVGNGPQTGVEVKKANHYFIGGLATGITSDPKLMAGGAKDYRVTVKHTFLDGFLNAITLGIYTPTTTIVTK